MKISKSYAPFAAAALATTLWCAPAHAVDWNAVQGKNITMFYPGQASWEWVLTPTDHSGAPVFRDGKNCHECHDVEGKSEAAMMGDKIASGKKLEPAPIPGKAGHIVANVKMAHDADKLYVRFEFPDMPAAGPKMDPDVETKVTMMVNDGVVKEANRAGCWVACHDDLDNMASATPGKENTKYLMRSRVKMTRHGGPDIKPAADLDKMRADGEYLEYWQADLNPGKPASAREAFVLEKREYQPAKQVAADGKLEGGKWVVVISRKLKAGAPYKDLEAGKIYTIGFAIHGGYAAHRYHWVSFEKTMTFDGGNADFVVK